MASVPLPCERKRAGELMPGVASAGPEYSVVDRLAEPLLGVVTSRSSWSRLLFAMAYARRVSSLALRSSA